MPNIQDVSERAAQAAAVQLTAATNPFVVWGQSIADTFDSLSTLTAGATGATSNLVSALGTGYIFQEIANVLVQNVLNPGPLLNEFMNFNTNFGPVIETALSGTATAMQTAFAQLPGVLEDSLGHLGQGQFFEAYSKINGWFVLQYLGGMRPLIPILSIPAQFVANLPGAVQLPALLDVISEFAVTKAIFEPIVGSIVQTTEVLDAVREAVVAGNLLDAVTNLVNLPVLAVNALFNGFTPAVSTAEWQGLLDRGLFTYLAVTLPNQIANAIKPPAPPAPEVSTLGGPAEFSLGADTVGISIVSEGEGEGEGTGEGTDEGAAAGEGEGTGADGGAAGGEGEGSGAGENAGGGGTGGETGTGTDETDEGDDDTDETDEGDDDTETDEGDDDTDAGEGDDDTDAGDDDSDTGAGSGSNTGGGSNGGGDSDGGSNGGGDSDGGSDDK
ncbi:hypothetical protein H7J88_09870 [Mycolicibacterium flavescens]|uniref:PE-PGRS family protein n=1 Tax=Mycolicibacterium flavescens TaxID=1776 RepID=A0A1E3RRN6_MYCFV|nr:hypothetical protein [Mycolicibacterium flavescens]MCV7279955.1 hypothetical protein [Mycolicibacterium flavescens]ODQ92563.1 hypothetical protein BHQ18_02245 [Mycolicibacterium flavescens]